MRSDDFPLGLPGLRPLDQAKVELGNRCAAASISLAECARIHGVPGSLENPAASRIYRLKSYEFFCQRAHVKNHTLDFCCFGTAWRKRTRLFSWHCDLSSISRRCLSKKGICDRTGLPHVILKGCEPDSKRFWTAIAEPYPRNLCREWSLCFKNTLRAQVMNALFKACR